jgi:DNA-binding IclR family transcriptional regulator
MTEKPTARTSTSQSLDRGLAVLEFLAMRGDGATVAEVAKALELDRAGVYRFVNTLAARGLVRRSDAGRLMVGAGILQLARGAFPTLQVAATAEVRHLAADVGVLATLTVAEGNLGVAIITAEPLHSEPYLVHRPGFRHPLDRTASGIAILAGRAPQSGERDAIAEARNRGYAVSHGEVIPGAMGIAAPITVGARSDASIGVVVMGTLDETTVAPRVVAAAAAIALNLRQ